MTDLTHHQRKAPIDIWLETASELELREGAEHLLSDALYLRQQAEKYAARPDWEWLAPRVRANAERSESHARAALTKSGLALKQKLEQSK